MLKKIIKNILGKDKFNSVNYWENRYAAGGNSGDGSYGRLSVFKAEFINKFIDEKKINSAIELGCGDGHQLSIINYPYYKGLDVSETIVEQCRIKFQEDKSKIFMVYDSDNFIPIESLKADAAFSIDVLYHIVEENKYHKYLEDLFSLGKNYVVIYATNFHKEEAQHVLHRKFTDDAINFSEWSLIEEIQNPFPGIGNQESMANFYIYRKN
jgi:SAM-dependent methyltransferase